MNLTFKMTDKEFYLGWKYKIKKGKMKSLVPLIITLAVCAGFLAFGIIKGLLFFAACAVCIAFSVCFSRFYLEKKSVLQEYRFSPIINGENTVLADEKGISFFNSFEKIFVPYGKIFAFCDTKDYVIILPTFRKGIYVISKERYGGEELEFIVSKIKEGTNENTIKSTKEGI